MTVSMIAAVARNRVIGKRNRLPWSLPDDMKYFMQTTKGHPVIMGRKNYDSIPEKFRPLPNRTNIVVTRQPAFHAPGCMRVNSLEEALREAGATGIDEVFIIGGADMYTLGLPLAHRLYLTEVHAEVDGDVLFPAFDRKQWRETSRTPHGKDDRHAHEFDFVVYERTN
jgi:dihydrofolate reductase